MQEFRHKGHKVHEGFEGFTLCPFVHFVVDTIQEVSQ